jgi:hypothetical protein
MLRDGQIWESTLYVLKIEKIGNDFRGVIFRKDTDNTLKFIEVLYNESRLDRLTLIIKKMDLSLTNKKLTTTKGM